MSDSRPLAFVTGGSSGIGFELAPSPEPEEPPMEWTGARLSDARCAARS